MPPAEMRSEFIDVLLRRKTSREFNADVALSCEQLSKVLYYSFGCHGYTALRKDVVALSKTSPSGGGLTPIEAYTLVLRVEGLEPGIYHYNVEQHSLELLQELTLRKAELLVGEMTAGQAYFQKASALFILTARFDRSFWKYRNHQKAYKVLLMDAAHLSQTLYLVCSSMELGAFVTVAINDTIIEEELNLDTTREGVICITGCGITREDVDGSISLKVRPYTPRKTRIEDD